MNVIVPRALETSNQRPQRTFWTSLRRQLHLTIPADSKKEVLSTKFLLFSLCTSLGLPWFRQTFYSNLAYACCFKS